MIITLEIRMKAAIEDLAILATNARKRLDKMVAAGHGLAEWQEGKTEAFEQALFIIQKAYEENSKK